MLATTMVRCCLILVLGWCGLATNAPDASVVPSTNPEQTSKPAEHAISAEHVILAEHVIMTENRETLFRLMLPQGSEQLPTATLQLGSSPRTVVYNFVVPRPGAKTDLTKWRLRVVESLHDSEQKARASELAQDAKHDTEFAYSVVSGKARVVIGKGSTDDHWDPPVVRSTEVVGFFTTTTKEKTKVWKATLLADGLSESAEANQRDLQQAQACLAQIIARAGR